MNSVFAVVYRDYMIRRTSMTWMFFDMILPMLYLLMFGVAFDKALGAGFHVEGNAIRYNDFFLAGVLAMTSFGNAINQSYGFFIDRDNGIFYEHLTYPLTRGEFLLGKILFQGLMSLVQSALVLLCASQLLDVHLRIEFLPLILLGVVLGTAGWFFCMSIVTFLIRRNDTFNLVINAVYFVLMFTSSLFYPLEQLPGWLRFPAMANPLTWHTDVMRYLTLGSGDERTVFLQTFLYSCFFAISFIFAKRTLQRATE
jgi:ABC-2 type transport system permease protein